jgi:hypothetical protein
LYRDHCIHKLFQAIAGTTGDVSAVMHRFYNTSDFFKDYRVERDNKKIGLVSYKLFEHFLAQGQKMKKVTKEKKKPGKKFIMR